MSTTILTQMNSETPGGSGNADVRNQAVIKSTEDSIRSDHRGTGYRNAAYRSGDRLRFVHAPARTGDGTCATRFTQPHRELETVQTEA